MRHRSTVYRVGKCSVSRLWCSESKHPYDPCNKVKEAPLYHQILPDDQVAQLFGQALKSPHRLKAHTHTLIQTRRAPVNLLCGCSSSHWLTRWQCWWRLLTCAFFWARVFVCGRLPQRVSCAARQGVDSNAHGERNSPAAKIALRTGSQNVGEM